MQLCKYSDNRNEAPEISNPTEVIIFPDGYEKQNGICIGAPSGNSSCKFQSDGNRKSIAKRPPSKGITDDILGLPSENPALLCKFTENGSNTDKVLNGVLEMESNAKVTSTTNPHKSALLSSLTDPPNTPKQPVREFRVLQDVIASPGRAFRKNEQKGNLLQFRATKINN